MHMKTHGLVVGTNIEPHNAICSDILKDHI